MLCEDIVVLRQGRVVEAGPSSRVFEGPAYIHTQALLDAIPHFEPHVRSLAVAD